MLLKYYKIINTSSNKIEIEEAYEMLQSITGLKVYQIYAFAQLLK